MHFFPSIEKVSHREAEVWLPDVQLHITFYCNSSVYVVPETLTETSRMRNYMSMESMPRVSAGRLLAAKRLAAEAIRKYRHDEAVRNRARFKESPLQALRRK